MAPGLITPWGVRTPDRGNTCPGDPLPLLLSLKNSLDFGRVALVAQPLHFVRMTPTAVAPRV